MLKNKRRVGGSFGLLAVLALFAALLPAGAAQADERGTRFIAQSRAAGLSADQAGALQKKADGYLTKFGSGATQVAPDRIKIPGWQLRLTVPGAALQMYSCPYYYFCAYEWPGFYGDIAYGEVIPVENCYEDPRYVPWTTTNGSWINNQTRGTRARINYLNGTHWDVPGAYSEQSSGMGWNRVANIDPC
jgi:hypothetical protein